MKLVDALKIRHRAPTDAPPLVVALVCGFSPLHLETLLSAHLQLAHPERRVQIATGEFDDCIGNLDRVSTTGATVGIVVPEWSDFDPRLGLRRLGGWLPAQLGDILATAQLAAARLVEAVRRAAESMPIVTCLPTLSLPPIPHEPLCQASRIEVGLCQIAADLAASLTSLENVRLVSPQQLDNLSPKRERYDVKMDLAAGFPYQMPHTSVLAGLLAELVARRSPKKGIITDLDDTLWRGLVGEVGPDEIHWDLDHGAQLHGIYQQLLASLAAAGVLVAVASKNELDAFEEVFLRRDLLIRRDRIFPAEVHWNSKAESVGRILQAWNISADDVIFIDDTPIQLAEVQAAFPGLTCLEFPQDDDRATFAMFCQLRDLCGKDHVSSEDFLRLDSLQHSLSPIAELGSSSADDSTFLARIESHLTMSSRKDATDRRTLELINKTNQFNLNGRRMTDGDWQALLKEEGLEMISASYHDKFGALGKIAVILGRREQKSLRVVSWVMSCRAFSRQIEFCCLRELFDRFGAESVRFDFEPTAKNGPFRSFLENLGAPGLAAGGELSRTQFVAACPQLWPQVAWQES